MVSKVFVDFNRTLGRIKPMNAGNNGPKVSTDVQTSGNFDTFKMLHIPYARLHDSNNCYAYGAPHTVDVRAIFKDYSASPTDPSSYDFVMTDAYLKSIAAAGTEPFFRLGGSIEHNPRKWFTCAPPDFNRFAVICEHIIRHCTGSWAGGLNMKISYWEIWNEPDLDPDDAANKRCWQGSSAEFRQMFCVVARHLKKCFPELKIGGPAAAGSVRSQWTGEFLAELERQDIKLDFFSWHRYACDTADIFSDVADVRAHLDSRGQPQAESVLNEWNYVKGWSDAWIYSLEQEAGMKGAAFALCTMLGCQKLPLDLLMYYDMSVHSGMNGLWHPVTFDVQKTWYSYFMFEKLARLGVEAESGSDDPSVQVLGATDGHGRKAAVIGMFSDDDNFRPKKLEISLRGLTGTDKDNLSVRLLDEKTNCSEIPFNLDGDLISFNFNIRPCSGFLIQC